MGKIFNEKLIKLFKKILIRFGFFGFFLYNKSIPHIKKHSSHTIKHLNKHKHHYIIGLFGSYALFKIFVLLFGFIGSASIIQNHTNAWFVDLTGSCSGVTQIPISECIILHDFYNKMNGDNWTGITTAWIDTGNICGSWEGISCSGTHVSNINLPNNNVIGVLPNSLRDLSGLTGLNIGNNNIPLGQGRFVLAVEGSTVLEWKENPNPNPNKRGKIIFIDLADNNSFYFTPIITGYTNPQITGFNDPNEIIINNNDMFITYNWQYGDCSAQRNGSDANHAILTGCNGTGIDNRPGAIAKFTNVKINKDSGTINYDKLEIIPLALISGGVYSGNLSSPHGTSKYSGYLYITYRRQSIITRVPLDGNLTGQYFNYQTTFGSILSGSDISIAYSGRFYISIQSANWKGKIVSLRLPNFDDPQT
ncbi:MAG: hypothetical protein WC872_02945, partial [Candidatus Absconditabacterales bacterium]